MKNKFFEIVFCLFFLLFLCNSVYAKFPLPKPKSVDYWQEQEVKREQNLKNCPTTLKISKAKEKAKVRKPFAKGVWL